MATVNGPLFSLDASGTIASTAVFSKWKGRNYVRSHAIPANPMSDLQRSRRSLIQFLSRAWRDLTELEQAQWKELASRHNYSPFNAYTAYNADRYTQGLGPQATPGDNRNVQSDLFYTNAAGGVGRATLFYQIMPADKNDGWGWFVGVAPSLTINFTQEAVKAGAPIIADGTQQRIDVLNLAPGMYNLAGWRFAKGGAIADATNVLFTVTVT